MTFRSKFPFTLTKRRIFHTAFQIFKSLHQISPPYLHNIFQFSKDITGHVSRNTVYCKLFKVEKFRGFRGLIGDRKTFPAKLFRSSFKLEYHG